MSPAAKKRATRVSIVIAVLAIGFIIWRGRQATVAGGQNVTKATAQSPVSAPPLIRSSPVLTASANVVHVEETSVSSPEKVTDGEEMSLMGAVGAVGQLWRLHCAALEGRRGFLWDREMEAFRLVHQGTFEAIEGGGKLTLTLMHPGDRGFPVAFRPKGKSLPDTLSGLPIERQAYRQGRNKLETEMKEAASAAGPGTPAEKIARWKEDNRKRIVQNILDADLAGEQPAALESASF